MLLRPILAAAALLALAPAARADKFYFTTADEDAKASEGSSASFVEGVLLKEESGFYFVRVEGGEIQLPKASVVRIEKDGLTVAQLEERERAAAERLAAANRDRRDVQAAEASTRKEAAEAAAPAPQRELQVVVDFQGLIPNFRFKTFDPILDRVNLDGLARVVEAYLRQEVERAMGR
jgi:hypothetical protein